MIDGFDLMMFLLLQDRLLSAALMAGRYTLSVRRGFAENADPFKGGVHRWVLSDSC